MPLKRKRYSVLAAVLCVSTVCAPAWEGWAQSGAQVAQSSPANDQARRLLSIASGSGDDAATFATAQQVLDSRFTLEGWSRLRPILQRLMVHAVERATAENAELIAFDPEVEAWTRMIVTVQAEPPHAITRLGLLLAPRPKDVPAPPRLQPGELASATKARVAALSADDKFAGAVLVAHRGRSIVQVATGEADRDRKIPNRANTQFRFGSMGKMFTAVAIMQLVQAGRIDLQAPIGTYLKGYPNEEIARQVTINHLLTHTGGTGDIFGPEFQANRQSLRELKDYIALFGARPPAFPPGSQQAYSNYGFILMGRLVEEVSGLSYDDYLQKHIFAPARMTATGMQPETVNLPGRAVGYMTRRGKLEPAASTLPFRGTSAGGGYSTVADLLRFSEAVTSNRLLDAAHTTLLTTGGINGADGKLVRYDFSGTTVEGRRFVGHSGGAPGMNGELRIFPDAQYTVIVLANRDPPAASMVANFISDRLPSP
jgi:CubicO group peptidase (beta-lactamase class C family)